MAERFYRKVIRIRGEDSPNVRFGLAERDQGKVPSGKIIYPGVLPWDDYEKRRNTWDEIRQKIGLDALFHEGADALMFPPEWLDRAERIARDLSNLVRGFRRAEGIGIDPAEGGDKTSMTAVDRHGIIEQVSKKTKDTSIITAEAIAFGRKHGLISTGSAHTDRPGRILFDSGGGGKQHVDRMRSQGYNVSSVYFGSAPVNPPKRGLTVFPDRLDAHEDRYSFVNKRAQMYWESRLLIDPGHNPKGFGIPASLTELRRQLAPIPVQHDPEGRIKLMPKDKRSEDSKEVTLKQLRGCSPDEADSFALACFAMTGLADRPSAGVLV